MQLPSLTLYYPSFSSIPIIGASPPSWMILLALHEAGLPCTFRLLDFAKNEHKSPDFLALHPKGTLPVLTCDQTVVTESMAILHFLSNLAPDAALLPPLSDRPAHALALQRFHESAALKNAGLATLSWLVRNRTPQSDPHTFDTLKTAFLHQLEAWEGFAHTPFLAGEHLSLADLVVFSYLATFHHLGLPLTPYLGLSGLYERLRSRPSIQATWPETWSSPLTFFA